MAKFRVAVVGTATGNDVDVYLEHAALANRLVRPTDAAAL